VNARVAPQHGLPPTRSVLALRGVFWSAVNVAVPTLSSLLVFVLTSRLLTPADFGVVALAAALAAAAAALVPAGFGDALVQRMEKDPAVLDSVFWLCVGAGAALYGVLVTLAPTAARLFHAPALTVLVPVLGLRVIADTAAVVPTALVTQALSFHLIALRTLVATLVSAALSIGLLLVGFGLWALVASLLANASVGSIAIFWSAGWTPRARFRLRDVRVLSGYGAFASGTRVLNYLGTQADQAVVGLVLGTVQLGFYTYARRVFWILNNITSGTLNTVAHPLFAGVQDDRARVRRGFLLATFLASVIAFPLFVGLGCVADRAIPLVSGPQWTPALWPVRILCALGIIACIGMLQAGLITSLGRANWWFYYQLGTNLLNIPIIVLFAPYGTSALLLAMAGKSYLLWPVPVAMTLRLLSMRAGAYLAQFVAPLVAALAMSAAILVERSMLPAMPGAGGLAVDIGIGAATYAIVLTAAAHGRLRGVTALVRGLIHSAPSPAKRPKDIALKCRRIPGADGG
jgi:teichuronic acid exporter